MNGEMSGFAADARWGPDLAAHPEPPPELTSRRSVPALSPHGLQEPPRRRHRQPCPELPEQVRQVARDLGDQLDDAGKGRWRQLEHPPVLLPAVAEAANPLVVDLLQQ